MTLRSLYVVVALVLGTLFALTKVAVVPSDAVRATCKSIKKPADAIDRSICAEYDEALK